MGAWGIGVFDSDSALDYLAALADGAAQQDDEGEIVPGSVNHDKVIDALTQTLAEVTRPAAEEDDDRTYTVDNAYAAAGLVAAAHTGHTAKVKSGTRLFAALAGDTQDGNAALGLGAHCGFVALLRRSDAQKLLAAARDAVEAIKHETAWLDMWGNPIQMREQLDRLTAALT